MLQFHVLSIILFPSFFILFLANSSFFLLLLMKFKCFPTKKRRRNEVERERMSGKNPYNMAETVAREKTFDT